MFLYCMPGWRALACFLDNLVPHRVVAIEDGVECKEGRLGFGWVCKLHDWLGNYGED